MPILFVLACVAATLAIFATLALSSKPCGMWCHLRGLARAVVLAGMLFGAARTLETGVAPTWDVIALAIGLAVIYCVQARTEALRQQPWVGEERRQGPPT